METTLDEIFLILMDKRKKYAESLIYAPLKDVETTQIKIKHIDEMQKFLSDELKNRRKLNAHHQH